MELYESSEERLVNLVSFCDDAITALSMRMVLREENIITNSLEETSYVKQDGKKVLSFSHWDCRYLEAFCRRWG